MTSSSCGSLHKQQGRISSSRAVFIAIVTLVFLWIASGFIFRGDTEKTNATKSNLPSVAVRNSQAQLVARELTLNGEIRPNQQLNIRARTDGMLEMIADSGAEVSQGDVIAKLSIDDREVQRTQAEAQVKKAQSDFNATKKLIEQNLSSQSQLQALEAQLEAARAQLRRITFDIENTELTAPVSGVINQRFIEQGAYVSAGNQVLELIDNDPLIAIINVQQSQIHRLKLNMPATVKLIGGTDRQGQVSFIAPIADPQTRTFRVEITIPNQNDPIPSGMSAEVTIETNNVKAHKISAAQIKIDAAGRMGVLTINDNNETRFSPVTVERADVNALWVSGLDDETRLVIISHSSLTAGQKVTPKPVPADYDKGEEL
ncbi:MULTISPECIES: efflux RND transporter periplasmic adaptor subunit [Idiomarinaceae]|jgi:multidrug efflux system membrane fusion protein|uniref:Efflux RND transporter periplasmic adaptor subunit n=2 Tax=Idiomarinaceae TaxID=267893 RepID=A0A432XDF1_9GAMM|nr:MULTISPECIES: efflux RND transporter periplasmic adaptor subunit [Idiomarinaceae]RUO46769.1 efflux RND transporter periplasmic adaptor subunit [Pseudidiomarina donghaiensis]TDP27009.1 multidrug efflux system membrane fusion protein [Idiomarina aquatica]SFV24581.1 membrane fusion protein, multidrug efflux system [Pseudidiomarina donghaiensis]